MNVLFVSPQFPDSYWHFCQSLANDGATVLGIGDTPYDNLSPELKGALTEYYWLPSLENYDEVYRATAFLSFKHGKIDWIESNNEYWLSLDARLREDFNVTTGVHPEQLRSWQSKALMKPCYKAAGIPVARQIKMNVLKECFDFADEVGYPVFCKPEVGVGAGGAWKIEDERALAEAFKRRGDEPYVLEEFVTGDICSYDAIVNSKGEPLFENQEEFPPSMSDVATLGLDVSYYSKPKVDPKLRKLGRAAVKSFGIASRFVHMEFFRLNVDKPGLGSAGDYVGLEINARPPGGYTPDIINYAHASDVYQIWADMVCFDERRVPESGDDEFAVHASRRDRYEYKHSHEEIMKKFGAHVMAFMRIPDALSDDLGNEAYIGRFKTRPQVDKFVAYVHEYAE